MKALMPLIALSVFCTANPVYAEWHQKFLASGEILEAPGKIWHTTKDIYLQMQQDGNLVLYHQIPTERPKAIWASGTASEENPYFATLSEEGTLLVYRGTPGAVDQEDIVYSSLTKGSKGNYVLAFDIYNRLTIFKGNVQNVEEHVWSNIRYELQAGDILQKGEMFKDPDHNVFLLMQSDGNLVAYRGADMSNNYNVVWSSRSSGKAENPALKLGSDGTITILDHAGPKGSSPIWTRHIGTPFFHLDFDDRDLIPIARYGLPSPEASVIWKGGVPVRTLRPIRVLEEMDKGLATISSSEYDIGRPENCFNGRTGGAADIMRSAGISPAFVQIKFEDAVKIAKIRVFVGQPGFLLDRNNWMLETADSEEDLENRTGSYEMTVAKRLGLLGAWDEVSLPFEKTAKVWRFTMERTVGGPYVHIHELELWSWR